LKRRNGNEIPHLPGWHNYHHAFPWDYKTGEYTNYFFNFSLIFIDLFAYLGWATDLKTTTPDMIVRRAIRTGDGSHPAAIEAKKKLQMSPDNNNEGERETRDLDHFWGWDDPDMLPEDKEVLILHQSHAE
jgi:stearoyl-CoA desaturase (delta-9 desaturase)